MLDKVKVASFSTNSNFRGIFKKIYTEDNTFASFKSSKQASDSNGESSITDDSIYWMSEDEPNPYFILIFNRNTIMLSNISLCSCVSHSCVYEIDVLGSNKEDKWENICNIRKTKNYFYTNKQIVECKSKVAYKMIKLVNAGLNFNDNYKFSIRHLDLYGDLYVKIPGIVSRKRCMRQSSQFHCILLLFTS